MFYLTQDAQITFLQTENFSKTSEITSSVKNPDGSFCRIEGIGEVEVELRNENGSTDTLIMRDVLFVPSFETNLVSVSKLVEKGHRVEFSSNCSQLKTEQVFNKFLLYISYRCTELIEKEVFILSK